MFFILIRFDRLPSGCLGFNVCLIKIQRHHIWDRDKTRSCTSGAWKSSDICWYNILAALQLPNQLQKYNGQRVALESKNETLCSISANAAASNMQIWRCAKQSWVLRMQISQFHNGLVVVRLWQPKQLNNKTCPLPGLAVNGLARNLQILEGSIFLSADRSDRFHILPNFFNKRLIPTSLLSVISQISYQHGVAQLVSCEGCAYIFAVCTTWLVLTCLW